MHCLGRTFQQDQHSQVHIERNTGGTQWRGWRAPAKSKGEGTTLSCAQHLGQCISSNWTKNETLISCCFDKWPWTPFPTTKLWCHSDALMSLLWKVKDSLSLFQIVPASQVTRNQGQLIYTNCFQLSILPLDKQSFKLNSCLAKPALPCTINLKREFHVFYFLWTNSIELVSFYNGDAVHYRKNKLC